ncbi:MAG: hypothetical protein GY951_13055 [Psychromonas sp.]|nr:hypothetical protein [Psychromonas sp.]
MSFNPTLDEILAEAKQFINASVWDGDRTNYSRATFTPDDLQDLIDDVLEHLYENGFI